MGDCVTGECKHEYADECVGPLREIVHDLRTANAKLKAQLEEAHVVWHQGHDRAEKAEAALEISRWDVGVLKDDIKGLQSEAGDWMRCVQKLQSQLVRAKAGEELDAEI